MKSDSSTNIKNNFGAYLDRVKRGESVLVLEYGRPVAQITKPPALENDDSNLSALEREGLVSRPLKASMAAKDFLKGRRPLKGKASLLSSLLADREDSL